MFITRCVARYVEEKETILCGKPDIPWRYYDDLLPTSMVAECESLELFKQCYSYRRALERKREIEKLKREVLCKY